MDSAKIREIEQIEAKIAELERRLPAHSVPPAMLQQLEELEEELERVREGEAGDDHSGGGDVEAGDGG